MHAGSLAHALDRLLTTGRVLYVAAHPDDENTRLLTYFANARHLTAAYLSMTRGGGGQNLIGKEQAELLDVIRTEELLAARSLDGAWQRFSRMRDFGYSKSADETFEKWGHEEALADVVWVIRTFQPDVIITRFTELPPNHGHHTASAILAREAFSAAADPARFPEQLTRGAKPWQATRLLHNVTTFNNAPIPKGAIPLDVGGYDARLGMSYGEIAARSRSQHQSQGFGVAGERGSIVEHFVLLEGAPVQKDLLESIDLSWKRLGDQGSVQAALAEAQRGLSRDNPEKAIEALVKADAALAALPDSVRVRDARRALVDVIGGAAGLFVRATSARPSVVVGGRAEVEVEVVLGRATPLKLERLSFSDGTSVAENAALKPHEKKTWKQDVAIAADAAVSMPYWLAEPSLAGRQEVRDLALVGAPRSVAPLAVTASFALHGRRFDKTVPVQYAWIDRVLGERLRRTIIAPPATVTPLREAVLLPNGKPAMLQLRVRAHQDGLSGQVVVQAPPGYHLTPAAIPVVLARAGDEASVSFEVRAEKGAVRSELVPAFELEGRRYAVREDVIDYPHIPVQTVMQPTSLAVVPLDIKLPKGLIGYIPGSGDSTGDDLAHVGVQVERLSDETLRTGDLKRFAAILVGIRAYNTNPTVRAQHDKLMRYVEQGGTVVVQYNTHARWAPLDTPFGPYAITLGRGRITDENATMTPRDPKHELLATPNRISEADFAGWVQERGLYYAETWDPKYTPIFSAKDKNEEPLTGGVLYAKHGKGRYIYTGLAFFRQLPAGVPGAYRLLVNMLGAGR